ncbi:MULTISPECIES: BlaI/MecI/CopY family transcriptional regulator [Pseudanabaena]|uniref:Transcriptional repressor, CopY family n=2 Tax=Pseudanabaena TaxID=1152 RepID=L8MZH4_9CYAN|nr:MULTISPECIES: BlaI/MecI/CopY family transcriptional regulator [Pseudanabaena]ELS33367.1 transcriptional repressor, CopY family [Pseudanabaena biceps PCC 7429]MDG3494395.1 BlaI/MecI/CopY family transcriptional regulator [Pseudanabaena catenata USMAC16]
MTPLPQHRPKQLSLGPLESEILNIIWDSRRLGATDIHDRILSDPDRELAYGSVMTVLRRLEQKGWIHCEKEGRALYWQARITREEAQTLKVYHQLNSFLEVGDADIVAAFANDLDRASVDKLEAIAARLKTIRQSREQPQEG